VNEIWSCTDHRLTSSSGHSWCKCSGSDYIIPLSRIIPWTSCDQSLFIIWLYSYLVIFWSVSFCPPLVISVGQS